MYKINENYLKLPGSYLFSTIGKKVAAFQEANPEEVDNIRKYGLFGVEFDDGLYTLAIANMIIRKDGKSNIYKGDCFNKTITKELKEKNINIGLIFPERCSGTGVCGTFTGYTYRGRDGCRSGSHELCHRNKV